MKHILKFGILIGVVCGLWTYIMGFLGWYKDPALLNLFWLVIIFQVIILFIGLKQTAPASNYWQQVGGGTLMSAAGSIVIFISSIILTTVVFPNYFNELKEINRQMLLDSGKNIGEVDKLVEQMSIMQTPFYQALFGMLGTIFTGLVASLIIGAFKRKKT